MTQSSFEKGMPGFSLARRLIIILATLSLASCICVNAEQARNSKPMISNPVTYFEIPVTDMDRAVRFYEAVFATSLVRKEIDGLEMALFAFDENGTGVSGALAKGNSYVPSHSGPRIYFSVESIDRTLSQAISKGGRIAYPKTSVGDFWVAEFEDSEGNQIALSSTQE